MSCQSYVDIALTVGTIATIALLLWLVVVAWREFR